MSTPKGIPAKVTKVRGRMAFVEPLATAPAAIGNGDWFRSPCANIGDGGVLMAPTPGAMFQDWLFALAKMNPHWDD